MSTILVTVIFLLASGAPASHAWVQCNGLTGAVEGDDDGETVRDPLLLIDSRGAMVVGVEHGLTIRCIAWKFGERWHGSIVLDRSVIRISLQKEQDKEEE